MIGTKLAQYKITCHLGTGCMAGVYEVVDSKVGSSLAIKFLPEGPLCDAIWVDADLLPGELT